jgi:hypothetical protein
MGRGGEVMDNGTMIDLIEEAIHTEGDLLSDEQVLDIIEGLLKKREGK